MSDITQKENSLLVAYKKAAEILRGAPPQRICSKTGARFGDGAYRITFLGSVHEVSVPDVRFTGPGLPTIAEVLILHYLTHPGEASIKGEFVSFSSIPNGMFYFTSFRQRALDKLVSSFAAEPGRLLQAAAKLGGTKWNTGEYSCIVPIFPKIDMVCQIFPADDEFPADANILYSDNVVNFLPAEDTAFLGGYLVGALARS